MAVDCPGWCDEFAVDLWLANVAAMVDSTDQPGPFGCVLEAGDLLVVTCAEGHFLGLAVGDVLHRIGLRADRHPLAHGHVSGGQGGDDIERVQDGERHWYVLVSGGW